MKKKCKICNEKFLDFINLGKHPCADTFLKNQKLSKNLKKVSLKVGFCKCSHLTAIFPIPQKERYQRYDYSYTSDNSPVSRSHFKEIAKNICKKYNLNNDSLVIEAGSNDGTFLKEITNYSKSKIFGIDPSRNINILANKKNIPTLTDFFNFKTSEKIKKKIGKADIFYGANVFNHVGDNLDFLDGVYNTLKDDGKLILEVPDLNSLIQKVGFDTIYHEHRHYYSEKSLEKILKIKNFNIIKIEKINYMAGSIRVYAHKTINKKKKIKLSKVNLREFLVFKKKIKLVIKLMKKFVINNINKKVKVYGIGAATKGNTLLNCCNFNEKKIISILEKSKYKIGKFTPGSGIKIIDEKGHYYKSAYVILPWNITRHLKKKFEKNKKTKYISIQEIIKKI